MLYKKIRDALSNNDVESLTLNLINNQFVEITNYDSWHSDKNYLYITEPKSNIVLLQYVVNINVNFKK